MSKKTLEKWTQGRMPRIRKLKLQKKKLNILAHVLRLYIYLFMAGFEKKHILLICGH